MAHRVIKRVAAFCRKEPVLLISFICVLISLPFVPPSAAYASYFDWRVISLLFCLMAVVAGFREYGLFEVLAKRLLKGKMNLRRLCVILVLLPFFSAMFITNDVALITFVPFAISVFVLLGRHKELVYIVSLQTIAANLGSMATPVGNPQSLFIYAKYHVPAAEFFTLMLPPVGVSLLLILILLLPLPKDRLNVKFPQSSAKGQELDKRRLVIFALLFAASLLAVFRVVPYGAALVVVFVVLLAVDRRIIGMVDYPLLLTFCCFFVFAGNMGQILPVRECIEGILARSTLLGSLLASQFISNVPAAVLLSSFTSDYAGLLLGVNIGGLGTLIASLASLISLKFYLKTEGAEPLHYLRTFTLLNLAAILVLLPTAMFVQAYII